MAIVPSLSRLCTLGQGSTATVSLASDPISGRLFAIKSAELSFSSPLQHEHCILSTLSSPHIISCHGSYTSNSHFHLLLEFAPGGSLFDRIGSHTEGRLEEHSMRSYAGDILLGLSYLHSNHISHGDIKSQNILIGSDGRAKIADFGSAVLETGTHNEKTGSLSGTPAFMAPEVARGGPLGPAADMWALGCTIIEMATGKAPWRGAIKDHDVMAAIYTIGYCSDAVPEIPDWLSEEGRDFLANCLKRDPNERWSAEQLLQHPFVRFCDADSRKDGDLDRAISPQSALDFGVVFSEPETEEEEEEVGTGLDPVMRIRELAGSVSSSGLFGSDPDDEDWIEVRSGNGEGNGDVEISDQVDFFDYEEDSDLMLLNFFDVFDRINEVRVRCGGVTSDFDVCTAISINKTVNPSIKVLNVSSVVFFFLGVYFHLSFAILFEFGILQA